MKFDKTLLGVAALALTGMVFTAAPARAQSFEPIVRSVLKADLAEAPGMDAWKEEINNATGGLAYIDWHLLHFMQSPVLKDILPSASTPLTEDTACQFLLDNPAAKLDLDGLVDGNDNHLILRLKADLGALPDFAMIDCEPVIGAGEEGIRIRGFFYLPDMRIETASQHLMLPITMDASRIPVNTFRP